jgi:hypothetical protein
MIICTFYHLLDNIMKNNLSIAINRFAFLFEMYLPLRIWSSFYYHDARLDYISNSNILQAISIIYLCTFNISLLKNYFK